MEKTPLSRGMLTNQLLRPFSALLLPAPAIPAAMAAAVCFLRAAAPASAAPGDLDPAFRITLDPSDPSASIAGMALMPDNTWLVGGYFTSLNGTPSRFFDRVRGNGVIFPSWPQDKVMFDEYGPITQQMDGRILPGTSMRYIEGLPYSGFARLREDGSPDSSFTAPLMGNVMAVLPQADGKIVVGGGFFNVGQPTYLLRLKADGTLDNTFLPRVAGVNSSVFSMVQQADGKIVIAGSFTSVGGSTRRGLARIAADGSLDRTFNPTIATGGSTDPYVTALALQPDGKILVAGSLVPTTAYGSGLARLNPDGTQDSTFTGGGMQEGARPQVTSMIVQTDGKILVSGIFTSIGGAARPGIAKLNPDGSADPDFQLRTSLDPGSLAGISVQGDGGFLLYGFFSFRSQGNSGTVVRVRNTPATQSLSAASPRRVQWLRGGSSPEASAVHFESSPSETGPWTPLGYGGRIAGGWECAGLSLLSSGWIRARAQVPSGFRNTTLSLLETVSPFTLIPEIALRAGEDAASPEITSGQTAAVDFGEVRSGSPLDRVLKVENRGNGDLHVAAAEAPAGFRLVNPPAFPVTVEAGAELALPLRLDAAVPGVFSGTVVLRNDDPDEGTFSFPVSGTVVTPEIGLRQGGAELVSGQTAAVDFGKNIQGTPGSREFIIANTGSAPLLVNSVTVPAGFVLNPPFTQAATVAPGASLNLTVSLVSLNVGPVSGTLTVSSDDLDESSFTVPLSGEVFIPAPVATLPGASATVLNRQTGLREQKVRLANDTTATVPGYRIIIRGLPAGVTVRNAAEVRADGSVVVLVTQTLAPHSSLELLLEYASPTRLPGEISPQIEVEVVLDPNAGTTPPDGAGTLAIERLLPMADGSMLLEFSSRAGARYEVQYSADGSTWKTSPAAVEAAGNRCQWIDRGPPRTDSAPSSTGKRFYRVRELSR